MLDIVNISVQFSGEYLFDNINFRINPNEKIALVGANGTGKSTLLKIIDGREEPETGKIQKQKGISIGYLPQEFIHFSGKTLFDEVSSTFKVASELEKEETELNRQLQESSLSPAEKEKVLHRIGEIHHKKEEIDFYNINSRIAKVLSGLGFTEEDFVKRTDQFSGGWQMRIELAKILLADHDLILLDEPTNHLDIDSLQWVVQFLQQFKGSLIVVSHDKYFVNNVTDKTLEIFNNKVNFFNGNYDAYLKFKEERDEQLRAQLKNRERDIKQLNRFIERFRYKATKARQVQSRIKQLEKMEAIDLPEEEGEIDIEFPEPPRSGVIPVELNDLSKSYGDNLVFENAKLQVERGDKIAFVGPNGAGKTTMAKIIAGRLSPSKGEIKFGHNTTVSYYAQEVAEDLNLDNEILDEVSGISEDLTPGRLRSILGSFLFSDEDVFKKIKVLSGGEKSRVALAKVLLQKANLVILDEPTNHLDINSKKVLQNALIQFTGTLIIVSHDIDFIRPVVNKVVEIRNNGIKSFPGGIDYYLEKQYRAGIEIKKKETAENNKVTRKEEKRLTAELRQKKYQATKDLKTQVEVIENKIEELEETQQLLEDKLADPKIYSDAEAAKNTKFDYEKIKADLANSYEHWTKLHEELETIESEFEDQLSKNSSASASPP